MSPAETTPQTHDLSPEHVLRWYLDAGVDEAVGETPENRLKDLSQPVSITGPAPTPAAIPVAAPKPAAPKPAAPPSQRAGQEQAVRSAVELAQAATSLDELRAALEDFEGCALKKTAIQLVFGDGDPDATVMLVGEAPGADEDRQGVPFVGASGKLLDKMLASIELDRAQVFISNTVFWRPPGNRTPNGGEIAICMPFVERMIELVDPEILVTVGGPATHSLLAQQGSISRLRGHWFNFETPQMSRPVQAAAIYHPAYLLKSPAMKAPTWTDLLAIRAKLDSLKSPS